MGTGLFNHCARAKRTPTSCCGTALPEDEVAGEDLERHHLDAS
jgi:hypothetical protein